MLYTIAGSGACITVNATPISAAITSGAGGADATNAAGSSVRRRAMRRESQTTVAGIAAKASGQSISSTGSRWRDCMATRTPAAMPITADPAASRPAQIGDLNTSTVTASMVIVMTKESSRTPPSAMRTAAMVMIEANAKPRNAATAAPNRSVPIDAPW
jgi:hypothetical protein